VHSLSGDRRQEALDRLQKLLLRAARFEVSRRRALLPNVDDRELDELARTAADVAALCVVAQLDGYRGGGRFTTWAAKFAVLEAAVTLRKVAWLEAESTRLRRGEQEGSSLGLRAILGECISVLAADQRQVCEAVIIDGVPIDVVAERMQTTRGDVYERLRTARRGLRECLTRAGRV
jgi:RNA polymerase sigma-70 factor (ECF subfamily)